MATSGIKAKVLGESLSSKVLLAGNVVELVTMKMRKNKLKINVVISLDLTYTNINRTQHASQRCGPRWVF